MVWQNSGMFSNVDSLMEACPPRDGSTVSSTMSVRKKKRRATGAMVKKFNGWYLFLLCIMFSSSLQMFFYQMNSYEFIHDNLQLLVSMCAVYWFHVQCINN